MTMHDGPGEGWMLARIEQVRRLRTLPDDHDRPEPGWRRRLDDATAKPVPLEGDLLDELVRDPGKIA